MKRPKFEGYFAFQAMCELHKKLYPDEPVVDGGTRRAGYIFKALDTAYQYGFEDAVSLDDEKLKKIRKSLFTRDRDI